MIKGLNSSITKKLIWLAFLTAATFFVTNQAHQNETVQSNQPIVNTQSQPGSSQQDYSTTSDSADSPSVFRSSYKFLKRQPVQRKRPIPARSNLIIDESNNSAETTR